MNPNLSPWTAICCLTDIVPNTGVGALVEGQQIALFRLDDDRVFAIDNYDPNSDANVLSRGIVGDLNGEIVVASPIYKQHFQLTDGHCIEKPDCSVNAHAVRLNGDTIEVCLSEQLVQAA